MTLRDVRAYLHDIASACRLVEEFVGGKTYPEYVDSPLLRSAVERQCEIIGEALGQALKMRPDLEPHITNAKRIVSFRNRLIHGYATVADEVVWGVMVGYLPKLKAEVESLLSEGPSETG